MLPFSKDTVFVFGRDTLHAFLVAGHTAGSTAYLFRGVLFVGDAGDLLGGVDSAPHGMATRMTRSRPWRA